MINYLDELNESQQQAVLYCDGPSLVIAGAGSGKTRVLTYKIAYLMEHGYEPWSILALTFTNKAAAEMKLRVGKQVGAKQAAHLWMGTFHSIFARILRTEHEAIDFPNNFTIYDSADSRSLIKSIVHGLGLDDKVYKPNMIQAHISRAKNMLISPMQYSQDRSLVQMNTEQNVPLLHNVYSLYWNRCKQAGAMDFDDLLFYTFLLFRDHEEVRRKYQDLFKYILVDEYQDTNFAQHSIVQQLAQGHQHICVVGDDAQSIYSFRGAKIDNILNFTKQYQGAHIFKLEQNYRSTQTIVSAANSLIEKNRMQIPKEVFSEKEVGAPIRVFQAYSDMEEGEIISNKIARLHRNDNYEYDQFAVLYRTNAQSRIFEEALRKRDIPYKIYGGLSFYQRKEIKDVISYFRLTVNPLDEEAFKRVVNYPGRGIGNTTLSKVIGSAADQEVSLWEVANNPMQYNCSINRGIQQNISNFCELISGFIAQLDGSNAGELGEKIIRDSGIMEDVFQDNSPENMSRQENIQELLNGMKDFVSLREEEGNEFISLNDFLQEVSLLTDQDSDKEKDGPKVTLMTIHAAKGLEFANVFVVGMEENLFPSPMCCNSPRALEEERRLFYVAITRAKEHCFLSYAHNRYKYGKPDFCTPSRFLRDIDPVYLNMGNEEEERPQKSSLYRQSKSHVLRHTEQSAAQPARTDSLIRETSPAGMKRVKPSAPASPNAPKLPDLKVGQYIEHERFGMGEVTDIEGLGENRKATVQFKNAGEKHLLLRFARFTIID